MKICNLHRIVAQRLIKTWQCSDTKLISTPRALSIAIIKKYHTVSGSSMATTKVRRIWWNIQLFDVDHHYSTPGKLNLFFFSKKVNANFPADSAKSLQKIFAVNIFAMLEKYQKNSKKYFLWFFNDFRCHTLGK